MSTPLIVLASILAFFALVLIPFMMVNSGRHQNQAQHHPQGKQEKNPRRKKKKQ